jgi:hypothetical protein
MPISLSLVFGRVCLVLGGLAAAAPGSRALGQAIETRIDPPKRIWPTAIAIVVDTETAAAIPAAIEAYRKAVEESGLSTWLVVDRWTRPERVRDELARLAQASTPIEGAVLVGDVPVAMIRGAQHLTSAFKMDEVRYPKRRSSVPSDRFYEDFDLRFTFLEADADDPRLFYYDLASDSPQFVYKEIYSGRIAPAGRGAARTAQIGAFLDKAARAKTEARPLQHVLTVMGHGYESESLAAWESRSLGLREIFPSLYLPGASVVNLHHASTRDLKRVVLRELQDPALDLAVFHAHGESERQLLLGDDPPNDPRAQIEAVKAFLRSKMRAAKAKGKDTAEVENEFVKNLGVPREWFGGALDEAVARSDEAELATRDLYATDIAAIPTRPRVAILDECFNGCFVDDPYVAGAYLFGSGATVACVGNTVNILQDVWSEEHLGLLALGVSIGQWHQRVPYLESQVLGDPTFRFSSGGRSPAGLDSFADARVDADTLASMLQPGSPVALRALAVRISARDGVAMQPEYLRLVKSDSSQVVRLEALEQLARLRSSAFEAALLVAITDPCELNRRKAADLMGDVGRAEYLAPLLKAFVRDPSPRVVFNAREALRFYDVDQLKFAIDPFVANEGVLASLVGTEERLGALVSSAERSFVEDLKSIGDTQLEPKKRIAAIRTFRNYRLHRAVAPLLAVATRHGARAEAEDERVRGAAIEALGWFQYSAARSVIIEKLGAVAVEEGAPASVRDEALKTVKRLVHGANAPLTP